MSKEELYNKLLLYTGYCVLFTILGTIIGIAVVPPGMALLSLISIFIAFIAMIFINQNISMSFDYVISMLMGIGISPSINHYIGHIGTGIVLAVLVATSVISIGLSTIGYRSKKDLSYLESFMFIVLIGIIICGAFNMFLHFKMINIVITLISTVLFAGYIIVDMDMALNSISGEEEIPLYVMNLYLDFINLLLDILELISDADGDSDN